MRQFTGEWLVEARREGAARLILKSATGEEIFFDLAPDNITALRTRLDELAQPKVAEIETTQAPGPRAVMMPHPPQRARKEK